MQPFLQKSWLIEACNFIRKETLIQMFSRKFYKMFMGILFTEHLQATASVCDTTDLTDLQGNNLGHFSKFREIFVEF